MNDSAIGFFERIYVNICESKKKNKVFYGPGSGLHEHHILPKHSGGKDDDYNYTYLTPKEHTTCHYLLWRIYRNPNDLRSMKMLGVNLNIEYRRIIGKFCHENKIGMFNVSDEEFRKICSNNAKKGYETQNSEILNGIREKEDSWCYWASKEGRVKRASMGGSATMARLRKEDKKPAFFWNKSEEEIKHNAFLGSQAHIGKKWMYNPKSNKLTRVKPENIEEFLKQGFIFGNRLQTNIGKKLMINIVTGEKKMVKLGDIKKFLDMGFITPNKKSKLSKSQPNLCRWMNAAS